ncbi:HAMP domain-containing histidine kinase [Kribbella sp. NBC_00382]|uniref:sensor histidine kinase n=1 Tax=Kribbella sp. NBC_00382 TaxID=2975967 RepID=UPI002E1BE01E
MTTQPPPDDFPKYVAGTPDEETLEFGPSHNRPDRRPAGYTAGSTPKGSPRPTPAAGAAEAEAGPALEEPAANGNRMAAAAARTQGWWQEKLHQLSLHARVTLLAAVTVGLAVMIVSISAYFTVRQQMYHNLDESLISRAQLAAQQQVITDPDIMQKVPPDALGLSDIRMGLLTENGDTLGAPTAYLPPMGEDELNIAKTQSTEPSLRTAGVPSSPHYRVVAVPAPIRDSKVKVALVVAQSLKPIDQTLHNLGIVLWAVGLLGVIGAALAGNAIAQSGLRPLARLTGAAETIARTEDLRPIPVTGSDEITRLAVAFNAMLAALARSQDRQRRLVGDAGHELRTPLTSIRTNLDLLAQADKRGGLRAEDRQQLLDDVRAQMDELTALIGDLTELARDTPQVRDAELIEMQNVVEDALIKVRRRASGVEWDVQLSPFPVWGDERLLGRAVTNLLDNAAKYSIPDDSGPRPPEGEPLGRVTVRLLDGVLTITDSGPGIADADLPHVFERFYRSSEARSRPGSGLGLAIVKHAAEQHGGMIYARNAPGAGAQFTLWLPHAATQSR